MSIIHDRNCNVGYARPLTVPFALGHCFVATNEIGVEILNVDFARGRISAFPRPIGA